MPAGVDPAHRQVRSTIRGVTHDPGLESRSQTSVRPSRIRQDSSHNGGPTRSSTPPLSKRTAQTGTPDTMPWRERRYGHARRMPIDERMLSSSVLRRAAPSASRRSSRSPNGERAARRRQRTTRSWRELRGGLTSWCRPCFGSSTCIEQRRISGCRGVADCCCARGRAREAPGADGLDRSDVAGPEHRSLSGRVGVRSGWREQLSGGE